MKRTHVRWCIDIALSDQASKGSARCYLSGCCRLQIAHSIYISKGGTSRGILAVGSAVVHSQTLAARAIKVEEVTAGRIRRICKKIVAHACICKHRHHHASQPRERRFRCKSIFHHCLSCVQSHSELHGNITMCRLGYGHPSGGCMTPIKSPSHFEAVLYLLGH